MRVAINGQFWNQEFTGSGQYTRHLWNELLELNTALEDSYFMLGDGVPFKGVAADQQFQIQPPSPVRHAGGNVQKVWWEQIGLPTLIQRNATLKQTLDVVHYPYFAAPLLGLKKNATLAVTIHDLIPLALPIYSSGRAASLYFRLVSAAARRADLIFADSEYSKQDILKFLKVPSSKVAVVYLGVEARYQAGRVVEQERQALLKRYGLNGDERIIFYLGGFDVRKNLPMLVNAFARALPRLKELEQQDGGGRWTLVLGGKRHSSNPIMYPDLQAPIRKALGEGEDAKRVHFTGLIDEADKPLFYCDADMYVFPSRYEGFGLDPLEALASGAPVICSNATSLPEVVGQAALLVAPEDEKGWTNAIEKLASDPSARGELSEMGLRQAQKFTWSKTAERTLELYHMLECIRTRGN
jgi:glycosyltransferase involved in cell wall biosynthesis